MLCRFPCAVIICFSYDQLIDIFLAERFTMRSLFVHRSHPVMMHTTSASLSWKITLMCRPPSVLPIRLIAITIRFVAPNLEVVEEALDGLFKGQPVCR